MNEAREYSDKGKGLLEINPRAELLHRASPKVEHDEALALVQHKLAVATVIYEQHGNGGRAGVRRALGDVIDHLHAQGISVKALLPLFDLANALDDLDRKVVVPLLAPTRSRGRPPKAFDQMRDEAFVAVVAEIYVQQQRAATGVKGSNKAVGQARKALASMGFRPTPSESRIHTIRAEIAQASSDDGRRHIFDSLMRVASAAPDLTEWLRSFVSTGRIPSPQVSE